MARESNKFVSQQTRHYANESPASFDEIIISQVQVKRLMKKAQYQPD